MQRVDAFWHDDVLRHDTGAGVFDAEPQDWLEVPETHAENAERVRNMRGILHAGPLAERVDGTTVGTPRSRRRFKREGSTTAPAPASSRCRRPATRTGEKLRQQSETSSANPDRWL